MRTSIILGVLDQDISQLEAHLRDCIQQRPISWTLCRRTLQEARRQCLHGIPDIDMEHLTAVLRVLDDLSSPSAWPFLCTQRQQPVPQTIRFEDIEQTIAELEPRTSQRRVPRPLGKERVFLHAFSGRRRPGDLQHYLEAAFAKNSEGVILHVVSMDVVIDENWGDACNPATRDFWLRGARTGYVQGGLCGPPCETWSQARFAQVADALGRQPRPVRSREELWGLTSLALRELQQVAVGNELLLFSLELLICLACSEGFAALEHPGEPADPTKPSIWRLPIISFLCLFPEFETVDFAQGLLGAKTPKPTRFLTLNLHTLPKFIHSHRLCADLPKTTAIGKDAKGQWATTGLKEYPPALNRALGESFAYHLLQREWNEDVSVDPAFLERCRLMHVKEFGSRIGSDYHQKRVSKR